MSWKLRIKSPYHVLFIHDTPAKTDMKPEKMVTPLKRKLIFQTSILGFHVSFRGGICPLLWNRRIGELCCQNLPYLHQTTFASVDDFTFNRLTTRDTLLTLHSLVAPFSAALMVAL